MTTATDTAVCKFHVSLNVSDLNKSVGFYRALFGRRAAKQRSDYAKFEVDEPPLVISLIPARAGAGGVLNHAGLRVRNAEELVAVQKRLEESGYSTRREDNVACCYALQTKFWITDPDGTMWEVYVVHEDIDEFGEDSRAEQKTSFAQDVARELVTWEHRIPNALPERIPHAENSLDEAHFEGTFNLKREPAELARLLGDAFRALRPGGLLRVHGLAGDRVLETPLPTLPGVAALVERVPASIEPMRMMIEAGFVGVQYEKLSKTAYFNIGGVPMREIELTGRKPGYRPKKLTHESVYLGPLAEVTDDFGNRFPRGERVALNIHDWQTLSKGAAAGQFQFFPKTELPVVAEACCSGEAHEKTPA